MKIIHSEVDDCDSKLCSRKEIQIIGDYFFNGKYCLALILKFKIGLPYKRDHRNHHSIRIILLISLMLVLFIYKSHWMNLLPVLLDSCS